jgi:hypothetical protein
VLLLLIFPFAICLGSLLASIDHCGGVYVLCGEHQLVDICIDFLLKSFTVFFYCVLFFGFSVL